MFRTTAVYFCTIVLLVISVSVGSAAYSEIVYDAQEKLKELGYDPGPIDGLWGKKTQRAIQKFQQGNGLAITGKLDKQTIEKLGLQILSKEASSLFTAISNLDVEAVRRILSNSPEASRSRHASGYSPMLWLVGTETMKLGAPSMDFTGTFARSAPDPKRELVLAEILVKYETELDATDNDGQTALMLTITKQKEEIAMLLIEAGADVRKVRESDGVSPLHFACGYGNIEVARRILEAGADVNTRMKTRQTPLHAAALGGYPDVVRLLIERGADIEAKDSRGRTPLREALSGSTAAHVEIADILRENGATK